MKVVQCAKCGKSFIPAYQHAYKEGKDMYCSWTCYNHRNDGKPPKEWNYRRKMIEVYDKQGDLLRRFKCAKDAAEFTGFSIKCIREACKDGKEYNGFLWKYKHETKGANDERAD